MPIVPDQPSAAERAALCWHEKHHQGLRWDCWCCCKPCKRENPHYEAAVRAALADIRARIVASLAPGRPPRKMEEPPAPLPRAATASLWRVP